MLGAGKDPSYPTEMFRVTDSGDEGVADEAHPQICNHQLIMSSPASAVADRSHVEIDHSSRIHALIGDAQQQTGMQVLRVLWYRRPSITQAGTSRCAAAARYR